MLDNSEIFDRTRGLLRAADDLREGDGRDAKLISKAVKPLAQPGRSFLDRVDTNIGVKHIAEH